MSARIRRWLLDPMIAPPKRVCGIDFTSCSRGTRKSTPSSRVAAVAPTTALRTMWRGLVGGEGSVLVVGVVGVAGVVGAAIVCDPDVVLSVAVPPELAIAPAVAPIAASTRAPAIHGKRSRRGGDGGGGGGGGGACGGGS